MSSVNILPACWLPTQDTAVTPFTLEQGALIYVKVGHIGANLLGILLASPQPQHPTLTAKAAEGKLPPYAKGQAYF